MSTLSIAAGQARGWVLPLALLALWEAVVQAGWVGAHLLPPPSELVRTLHDLASAPDAVLVAVPSQLLLMLQLAQRRHCAAVPQVRLVLISGAR